MFKVKLLNGSKLDFFSESYLIVYIDYLPSPNTWVYINPEEVFVVNVLAVLPRQVQKADSSGFNRIIHPDISVRDIPDLDINAIAYGSIFMWSQLVP